MGIGLNFRASSLKSRLISSYLVILAIGGISTSVVGSWIVTSAMRRQAERTVDHGFATARIVYEQQLEVLLRTVELATAGTTVERYLASGDRAALLAYLQGISLHNRFEFLSVTDERGVVGLRSSQSDRTGDDVSRLKVVRAALAGKSAAAAEIVSPAQLDRENPALARRAYTRLVATERAKPSAKTEETAGMALVAAAPVRNARGEILGVLYGGILLNGSVRIVDRVDNPDASEVNGGRREAGTTTIFQSDFRITTNVRTPSGERALGTRVSSEVQDAVLEKGQTWRGRAFVVSDWYLSRYDPIRDYEGKVIGMLYHGVPEATYTSIRDRVVLSFFGLAGLGFAIIIAITYYEIGHITQPVGEMVSATRSIAAGRFDQEVQTKGQGEIALLAESFNTMLRSLRQMRADLEEWGSTLEVKVRERSEQLVAMQVRVAQSERLASLGMLAAGVAHEVNNPLGAIMSLTALTLEDMPPDHPDRENLEEVVKQTARCRDIVRGLLEFSRQSKIAEEEFEVNQVMLETLGLISRQAVFFNIDVVKNLEEELPVVVGDPSQIQQVFMNVLLNAAQAMEEKGTLTITTRRSPGDGFVEVLVRDTGQGIPADKLGQIFDPFFTTKESGHGTGLGLSIAYGIITRHGGAITVQSELGQGTTFTIRLPTAACAGRS